MSEMYNRIEKLCKEHGINMTQMCKEAGIPRGNLTDLKKGRTANLSTKNLGKISLYFGVSIEFLLGTEQKKEPPATRRESGISDEELKFALWGNVNDIDDDDLADVKRYAAFVKERKKGT